MFNLTFPLHVSKMFKLILMSMVIYAQIMSVLYQYHGEFVI